MNPGTQPRVDRTTLKQPHEISDERRRKEAKENEKTVRLESERLEAAMKASVDRKEQERQEKVQQNRREVQSASFSSTKFPSLLQGGISPSSLSVKVPTLGFSEDSETRPFQTSKGMQTTSSAPSEQSRTLSTPSLPDGLPEREEEEEEEGEEGEEEEEGEEQEGGAVSSLSEGKGGERVRLGELVGPRLGASRDSERGSVRRDDGAPVPKSGSEMLEREASKRPMTMNVSLEAHR